MESSYKSDAEQKQGPDFRALHERFEKLDRGLQAALRRVAEPDDLRDTVALYRLFPDGRAHDGWLRVAFLLPWCAHADSGPSFGEQLAAANVNEARVLQVARATEPTDIVQLRRLAIQLKPQVDWSRFGWTLLKWDRNAKRQIVEDFYYAKTAKSKKGAVA